MAEWAAQEEIDDCLEKFVLGGELPENIPHPKNPTSIKPQRGALSDIKLVSLTDGDIYIRYQLPVNEWQTHYQPNWNFINE